MTPELWETKKALIVVRTYPAPAKKGIEVSCTAALTADREWLRLFPIPYRYLSGEQKFKKYQWIEVKARKSTSDTRLESFKINDATLRIVSESLPTGSDWRVRREFLNPAMSTSLCYLKRQQEANGHPTLGLFKPQSISRLQIEKTASNWTPSELEKLGKPDLFGNKPKEELEKIPYKFFYCFKCDDDSCTGHRLSCTDWEMGQAWRSWRNKYGQEWEPKFRERFETEVINKFDTHFFVGTVKSHPREWIIVGLFLPPALRKTYNLSLPLFD